MSKFIFILFLLVCSLNSVAQECFLNKKKTVSNILEQEIVAKEQKIKGLDERAIDLLLNNNLCEILSIKPSDILNEKMLKKLKANV